MTTKMKLVLIAASRGCNCCREDDHLRGPYRSRADAQRRINFFLKDESSFCPLLSHLSHSPRGQYQVVELPAERLGPETIAVEGRLLYLSDADFVFVGRDGTSANDAAEWFDDIAR